MLFTIGDLPNCLEILSSTYDGKLENAPLSANFNLNTMEQREYTLALNPSLIDPSISGPYVIDVVITNLYNPVDKLIVQVQTYITRSGLGFQSLQVDGSLLMPQLEYPTQKTPVECIFGVRRRAVHEPYEFMKYTVDVVTAPAFAVC